MIAMQYAKQVFGSYAITLGGVGAYVWWMLRRSRKLAEQVGDEDTPWT